MTNKEISEEALLQSIIAQLRSKGTLCGTGSEMNELRKEAEDNKRKAKEDTIKSMREIWKTMRLNK